MFKEENKEVKETKSIWALTKVKNSLYLSSKITQYLYVLEDVS